MFQTGFEHVLNSSKIPPIDRLLHKSMSRKLARFSQKKCDFKTHLKTSKRPNRTRIFPRKTLEFGATLVASFESNLR